MRILLLLLIVAAGWACVAAREAARAAVRLAVRVGPKRGMWGGVVLSSLLGVVQAFGSAWPFDFMAGVTCVAGLTVIRQRERRAEESARLAAERERRIEEAARLAQQREWSEGRKPSTVPIPGIREALAEAAGMVLPDDTVPLGFDVAWMADVNAAVRELRADVRSVYSAMARACAEVDIHIPLPTDEPDRRSIMKLLPGGRAS